MTTETLCDCGHHVAQHHYGHCNHAELAPLEMRFCWCERFTQTRTAPEAAKQKSNETTTAPEVGAVNPLKEDAP